MAVFLRIPGFGNMTANKNTSNLTALRQKIDDLDKKIVELLNERARIVVDIGKTKQVSGSPIYAPDREQAVLKRIAELNPGPLPPKTLQAIYRELMSDRQAVGISYGESERTIGGALESSGLDYPAVIHKQYGFSHLGNICLEIIG